jgi:hypothetical protein
VDNLIFILFSAAAVAAVVASPINFFKSRNGPRKGFIRGEIILLNDLHRTSFRKH